jgi:hypothetical protein
VVSTYVENACRTANGTAQPHGLFARPERRSRLLSPQQRRESRQSLNCRLGTRADIPTLRPVGKLSAKNLAIEGEGQSPQGGRVAQ